MYIHTSYGMRRFSCSQRACEQACMPQQIQGGWLLSLNYGQCTIAEPCVPWLQLAGLCKPMSKAAEVMPRCACDTDAKRPCAKRAAQRVLAPFTNALIAPLIRSMMPLAGRSHLSTSGHAAQEQCHLPHAIAMASHTAHGAAARGVTLNLPRWSTQPPPGVSSAPSPASVAASAG